MKNKILKETILILISIIPIIYILLVWDSLPNEIATHFDLKGNANGFTKKSNILLIVSSIMLFSYLTLSFIQKLDPKNQIKLMGNKLYKIKLLVILFMSLIFTFIIYKATNENVNDKFLLIVFALFFIIMGNYMQTVKPNFFIGIRTPWTLQSDVVWKKTHKIAGVLMMITGLLSIVFIFILPINIARQLVIISFIVSLIIPYIYSFFLFQKEQKRLSNS